MTGSIQLTPVSAGVKTWKSLWLQVWRLGIRQAAGSAVNIFAAIMCTFGLRPIGDVRFGTCSKRFSTVYCLAALYYCAWYDSLGVRISCRLMFLLFQLVVLTYEKLRNKLCSSKWSKTKVTKFSVKSHVLLAVVTRKQQISRGFNPLYTPLIARVPSSTVSHATYYQHKCDCKWHVQQGQETLLLMDSSWTIC